MLWKATRVLMGYDILRTYKAKKFDIPCDTSDDFRYKVSDYSEELG